MPHTKFSGRCSSPSPSSSPPICRSSPSNWWKAGSSSRWHGQSPLHFSARWRSPSSSRRCSALFFPQGVKEWRNPVMEFLTDHYRQGFVGHRTPVDHCWWSVLPPCASACSWHSAASSARNSCPTSTKAQSGRAVHWPTARASLRASGSPNQARIIFASFPEVKTVVSQAAGPTTAPIPAASAIPNTSSISYRRSNGGLSSTRDKDELIAAMNREVSKLPGAFWNFSQPIEDNVDETVSGVKGGLAVKLFGDDLKLWRRRARRSPQRWHTCQGLQDLGLFRDIGSAEPQFHRRSRAAARFGINASDIQDAIQTAVGGNAVTQVLQGEATLRRGSAIQGAVPQYPKGHRKVSASFLLRANASLWHN